jgi:hypothetical protein
MSALTRLLEVEEGAVCADRERRELKEMKI